MEIERETELNQLIAAKHNGFVKIITGIRRCGKSYLLFTLFRRHLLQSKVPEDHIVTIDLESFSAQSLHNPITLAEHIRKRLKNDGKWNYVLIDEIQHCKAVRPEGLDISRVHPDDRKDCYVKFYSVLSELRNTPNVDVYVTGSNSKLLARDVATEFRGRGQAIHIQPLSFAEFLPASANRTNTYAALREYLTYGGLPECVALPQEREKREYLENLFNSIYFRDLVERHRLHGDATIRGVTDALMSMVGTLTNPARLAGYIQTNARVSASRATVAKQIEYLTDAFLFSKALRYDIKGKRYLDYPAKYYAVDTGLRNARLNFRQTEYTHLMENAVYNELVRQGYSVDVGMVESRKTTNGTTSRQSHEIDFVVNRGYERIYIQSAWMIPDADKMVQETFSLKYTGDNFRKIVIDGSPMSAKYIDNDGIGHISLIDFLLDPRSLETL